MIKKIIQHFKYKKVSEQYRKAQFLYDKGHIMNRTIPYSIRGTPILQVYMRDLMFNDTFLNADDKIAIMNFRSSVEQVLHRILPQIHSWLNDTFKFSFEIQCNFRAEK